MKILAFSDLHRSRGRAAALVSASAEADLVIGAGDFCTMREGLDDALSLLSDMTAPMLAVPGNAESVEELRAAALPGMTVLHGTEAEIEGVTFFGLGGGVPPTPFGDWSYDLSEAEAEAALAGCEQADVLILHAPPEGIADRTSAGQHVGSRAIRAAIERIKPRLALCGHIHDCWGEHGMIGPTKVVNLGPVPNWFELPE